MKQIVNEPMSHRASGSVLRSISVLFLLFTFYFLFVSPVEAATYYIAPDKDLDGSSPDVIGNDSNPGIQSQPWKTFNRA